MNFIQDDRVYVPALPTFSPLTMVQRKRTETSFLPFSSGAARYFYFARNGIYHAAKALGLDGAEVLVPAYHHGVEIEALMAAGAVPRFYPLERHWDVDIEGVRRRINTKTKAIYLIHYAGFPARRNAFRALADEFGLQLWEDCALALLSSDEMGALGSLGDVSVFCLYKTLPVPNGGSVIVQKGEALAFRRAEAPPLFSTARHMAASFLQHVEFRGGRIGSTLRNEIRRRKHAVVLNSHVSTGTRHFELADAQWGMSGISRKLWERLDLPSVVKRRRRNFQFLKAQLVEEDIAFQKELSQGVCPLFFPVEVKEKDLALSFLSSRGIEAIDFWRHFHPACEASEFPEVRQWRETIVEIPCHQDLEERELLHQVKVLKEMKRLGYA